MEHDALKEALEDAVLRILDGSPYGPALAGRIQREARAVLHARGLKGTVEVEGGGRRVRIALRDGPRVRAVVLTFQPL